MNKLLLAATAVIGFAAINGANAADLALKAPPPPLVVDEWTGPYIGLNLGGSWGRSRTSYNDPDPAFVPFTTSQHMDGVLGGAQIGYNVQFNRIWLAGLEADFQGTGQRGSATFPPDNGDIRRGRGHDSHHDGNLDAKVAVVRHGARTAGRRAWRTLAALRDRRSGLCADQEHRRYQRRRCRPRAARVTAATSSSVNNDRAGWTAGAGAEWMFANQWSAKVEYLYMDYGHINDGFTGVGTLAVLGISSHVTDNVLRAGVNLHFH